MLGGLRHCISHLPLGVRHRCICLGPNSRDLDLGFLPHPSQFSRRFLSKHVGFFAVTFSLLGPVLGEAGHALGRGAAPLSVGDLAQSVTVRVLDLCTGRFEVARSLHNRRQFT